MTLALLYFCLVGIAINWIIIHKPRIGLHNDWRIIILACIPWSFPIAFCLLTALERVEKWLDA